MRRPEQRLVEHSFDREDGSAPESWRMPDAGMGWNAFCAVYGQLDHDVGQELLVPLVTAYNQGRYEDARGYVRAVIERLPEAERELGIYAWTCDRVLAVEFDETDLIVVEREEAWQGANALARLLRSGPPVIVRCKWCGHFTPYVDPGVHVYENQCSRCSCAYPAPDFDWDSLQGMAYCAGSGSWETSATPDRLWNEFFDEYERRYPGQGEPADA